MLKKLSVSNLAIVEKAEAEFAPGLTVITGETGSGKSVLMGALELVLGGKAESSAVRDGAKEAEVEAEFDEIVVRRTVTAAGRTRAWVNDESVTVAELKELGARLVDVHGPRANQSLLEERFQRETLDAFGGLAKALEVYQAQFAARAAVKAQIAELQAVASGNVRDEIDMLRYQVGELEEANLTDEDETLAARHAAAAHAEEIVSAANDVTEGLGGDASAAEILIKLQPRFRELARHLPAAETWATEAEELTVKLQELSRSVADAASRLDAGEEDLDALDSRLTLVNRLKRKYNRPDVKGLLEELSDRQARLKDLETRDERLEALEDDLKKAEAATAAAGAELTKRRKGVVAKLAKAVTKELHDLGFLQAKFDVTLESCAPEAHGCDRVIYMFEPNPGEAARPLAAIASSGEIARVMLALKGVLAAHDSVGTLVFDEIDANIGGEVGKVVGEKLRAVARHRQVIAITHLPQSAAFGERHLVVAKRVSGGRTRTGISVAEGEERISEIARMLGGEKLTSVARKHAEELLELSR